MRQLRAHQQRLDSAGREEREAREEVEDADALVVDGREPAEQARPLLPDQVDPLDAVVRDRRRRDGYLRPSM
jgi:rhodanese-related sulfurtransferase